MFRSDACLVAVRVTYSPYRPPARTKSASSCAASEAVVHRYPFVTSQRRYSLDWISSCQIRLDVSPDLELNWSGKCLTKCCFGMLILKRDVSTCVFVMIVVDFP